MYGTAIMILSFLVCAGMDGGVDLVERAKDIASVNTLKMEDRQEGRARWGDVGKRETSVRSQYFEISVGVCSELFCEILDD